MRIHCLTTFLDGRERYEKDDIFTVDDTKGAYFVQNKWAKEVGTQTPAAQDQPTVTELAIDNAVMGMGDSNG